MAQFDHIAMWDDSFAMLRDVLSRGDIRLCLDQDYAAPELPSLTSLTPELEARLRQGGRLFLFGRFSIHAPIFYRQVSGPKAGTYYLREVGGGPLIAWSLGRDNIVNGQRLIVPGMLSTSTRYELERGRWAPASAELKAAYADCVKRMKKHLCRWEGLWISPGALQLLKEGRAELPGTLKPLGVLLRKAKHLPQLGPAILAPSVPATSKKTTKRKIAAKTATP